MHIPHNSEVEITYEHIIHGEPKNCRLCPTVLALEEFITELPDPNRIIKQSVRVDTNNIMVMDVGEDYIFTIGPKLEGWISKYDGKSDESIPTSWIGTSWLNAFHRKDKVPTATILIDTDHMIIDLKRSVNWSKYFQYQQT